MSEKYKNLVTQYVGSRRRGDAAHALRQALKDDVILERVVAQVRNAFNQAPPAQPQTQRRVVEHKTSNTIINEKESAFHSNGESNEKPGITASTTSAVVMTTSAVTLTLFLDRTSNEGYVSDDGS